MEERDLIFYHYGGVKLSEHEEDRHGICTASFNITTMIDVLRVHYFNTSLVSLVSVLFMEGLVDKFILVMFHCGAHFEDVSSIRWE